MQIIQDRRTFLSGLSAADSAVLFNIRPSNAAGEPPMIKSSPQQIIENGTDFRFLNELKRELKT